MDYSRKLESLVGRELNLRINNNRSTMLHVRWHEDRTDVSLHKMFIRAPYAIQRAIAKYIRQDDEVISEKVHAYIDSKLDTLDPVQISKDKMVSKGVVYDLKTLYKRINRRYFGGRLKLAITWFGNKEQRVKNRCTLGVCVNESNLIKIHRLLDREEVPLYVIEYVIYHELVHAVCPPYKDEKGRNRIHTREFKELEQKFLQFDEAIAWLKLESNNFFATKRKRSDGRTQQVGKYQAQKKQGRRSKRQSIFAYF